MTTFIPSAQQQAVFDFVTTPRGGNAFVEAVAGAGKTTTLVEACKLMAGSVAFAAFNKKIAVEIESRVKDLGLGSRIKAGTFHSFGLNAWRRAYPKVKVDAKLKEEKVLGMCDVNLLHKAAVLKLVSLAKQSAAGLLWEVEDESEWYKIVSHHDIASELEDPAHMPTVVEKAREVLAYSVSIAHELVDFDDMIYMPAVTNIRIWENDWVLVDEAQDTNPARRVLTRKMLSRIGRAIFVGDRHQAIYGFTGADNDAIDQIIRDFRCQSLPLTTTYRCPKAVVREAQRYVSHIQAHESAPEGSVSEVTADTFNKDVVDTLTPADAILCRNTKPLVSLAFSLIRRGVGCHVEGRDIGAGLISLATRWKAARTTDALRDRLDAYEEREVSKLMAKGKETQAEAVADRVDTVRVIMRGCATVQCVVDKIRSMFKDTEAGNSQTLTLSTVHKAKGREWNRVFILGYADYMPSKWARQEWQLDQENNLVYVAVTRSKDKLVLLPKFEEEKRYD